MSLVVSKQTMSVAQRYRRSPRLSARVAPQRQPEDSTDSNESELDVARLRVRALESRVARLSARLEEQSTSSSSEYEVANPDAEESSSASSESEYVSADECFTQHDDATDESDDDSAAAAASVDIDEAPRRRRAAQRRKKEELPQRAKWNLKSHGAQFALNRRVMVKLTKALESNELRREAKHLVKESLKLLGERNKTLWLADDHGWDVAVAFSTGGGLKLTKTERRRLGHLLATKEKARGRGVQQESRASQHGRPSIQCFRCRQYGHVQRNCPFPRTGQHSSNPGSTRS